RSSRGGTFGLAKRLRWTTTSISATAQRGPVGAAPRDVVAKSRETFSVCPRNGGASIAPSSRAGSSNEIVIASMRLILNVRFRVEPISQRHQVQIRYGLTPISPPLVKGTDLF